MVVLVSAAWVQATGSVLISTIAGPHKGPHQAVPWCGPWGGPWRIWVSKWPSPAWREALKAPAGPCSAQVPPIADSERRAYLTKAETGRLYRRMAGYPATMTPPLI